jgi:hypothetical protein
MANTGFKGVDIRQSGSTLLFRAFLQDTAGNIVSGGTTSLYIYELQDDGSIKSYDFSDKTLKTTALTTETASMTHRTGNNSTRDTGLWTYSLVPSGLNSGAVYVSVIESTLASPTKQAREFQYGEILSATDIVGNVSSNVVQWSGVNRHFDEVKNADVYYANIKYLKSVEPGSDYNKYACVWFKNGQPLSSGSITGPRLSVYNIEDNSVVVNNQSMTYSDNKTSMYYNTTTAANSGIQHLVAISGTIDSSVRSWNQLVGIDDLF